MILECKKTLEARLEDEVKQAIDALIEDKTEELELNPVIEQQMDTDTYESTTYHINVGESKTTYEGKTYYELANNDETIGASMTAVFSEYEHELYQEAREMATQMKQGNQTNHPFIEAQIDMNLQDKKNSVKMLSFTLWCAMYDGKLVFN